MIHYSDIHNALNRGNHHHGATIDAGGNSDLEDAFVALVGYPKEDDVLGFASLDDMVDTLTRVSEAMLGNGRIMPTSTIDLIREFAMARYDTLLSYDYRAGAAIVLKYMPDIRARLAAHFKAEA